MVADDQRTSPVSSSDSPGWNELGFVPWHSFRRMAPSILTLEVSRLSDLIATAVEIEYRNALVRARYELSLFVEDLKGADGTEATLDTVHLQSAILNLPVDYPDLDSKTVRVLAYILDRLQYVHNRIRFVYQ